MLMTAVIKQHKCHQHHLKRQRNAYNLPSLQQFSGVQDSVVDRRMHIVIHSSQQ
jgi:hypothetical protein